MKIQLNKLMLGALVVAGSVGLFSCSDEWDDHYSEVSSSATGPSIWETLNSNPNYSAFASVLKERGYDVRLSGSQTPRIYTVFAPTNEAMESYTGVSNVDDEFIENHISFFYQNVSSLTDTTVTMLNDKVMRLRRDKFGEKLDPIYTVSEKNIPCQNGLIQGISGVVPYKKNIWEFIDEQGGELKDYLFAFNRIELDLNESTEGYIDSSGQTVFLDSVTYLDNVLWNYIGELNNEDSVYASILYDNNAWEEGWAKAEKNFRYFPEVQGDYFTEGKDSLARMKDALIKQVLVGGMSFRQAAIDAAKDNPDVDLVRTTFPGVKVPKAVVNEWLTDAHSEKKEASNGTAYLTSEFLYEPADLWQDTITVQGESAYRLWGVLANQAVSYPRLNTDTLSLSPLSDDYEPGKKYTVSNGSYLYLQSSAAQSAQAIFGITDTQSGLYDLWITFIPASMVGGITPLPQTVRVGINYAYYSGTGSSIAQRNNTNVRTFEVDPRAVTRVKVAELPELTVCYSGFMGGDEYLYSDTSKPKDTDYFLKKYGLKVTVTNTGFIYVNDIDHNLYIDCIELVPHREN